MRRSLRPMLIACSLAFSLYAPIPSGNDASAGPVMRAPLGLALLSAADVARLSQGAGDHVIIILRAQQPAAGEVSGLVPRAWR